MGALQRLAAWIGRPLRVREPGSLVGAGGGPVARARAIVVLGAPLDAQDRLTEIGRERARAGAELWRRGGAPLVLVSGAVTRGAQRSEAAALADELVAGGVPRAAILLEERALTTAENGRGCAALLRAHEAELARSGEGGGDGERGQARPGGASEAALGPVWLVTQPFHGRRARLCFRRAGVAGWVWPIEDSLELRDPRRALRWSLREYLAWAKALVVR